MLNIPEEVKTLFKADSVFKNFHVHFPNSEYTDLNNDDIVSESVEFTESLCSQQAFRFGLTEASEIKFTCVNVPNIRGAVIECAIEVQADSLGAEWLADNQPTGNEEFLDPQVCTYSDRTMYRVPYGRFIVDTCPRNHETMYKRDVTAYTERMEDSMANPFQSASMDAFYPNVQTYTQNVKPLVMSVLYYENPDTLLAKGYTEETLTGGITLTQSETLTLKTTGGASKTLTFRYQYVQYTAGYRDDTNAPTDLYGVTESGEEKPDILSGIIEALETLGVDASASGYSSLQAIVERAVPVRNHFVYIQPDTSSNVGAFVEIPTGSTIMYPYIAEAEAFYLCRLSHVEVSNDTDYDYIYSANFPGITFRKYTDSNGTGALARVQLSFKSTLQTKKKYGSTVFEYYSFSNAFSVSDIVRGYLELQCLFGSPSRTGGMEITALDNTSPVSILPENYAELWYDETTIAPIGYVQVKFKDETGEEQDLTVQIGTGASVYDLRDNAVLQNMVFTVSKAEAEAGVTIESKLLAFLNSVFTPNIPDLTFIPIELTKKGLPYLEAGDAVTITTGDGQVVPSFILRQTVKGIQFLTADVESANGEAVEMVET